LIYYAGKLSPFANVLLYQNNLVEDYIEACCLYVIGRKGDSFLGNLPIVLFLLGVVFLFLGWRWQSVPNEEAMTALKGLAYLKREIIRVQDQVHSLEDRIQTTQQIEIKQCSESALLREIEHGKVKHREVERREIEGKQKSKLYSLKIKEDRTSGGGVGPNRNISPKYQEVLELAAKGHRIPEIAEHLLLSQDAVMMVLQTQSKGAAR